MKIGKNNFGVRFEFEILEGCTLKLKWPEAEGDYREVVAPKVRRELEQGVLAVGIKRFCGSLGFYHNLCG